MFNYQVAHATLASVRNRPPTLAWLEKQIGGLSKPRKMPGFSYSIPATKCKVGSTLRDIEGSVCANCYARKGRYCFPNVQAALDRRYNLMTDNYARWAAYMVALLVARGKGEEQEFRWHDSGDLQSSEHLEAIIWIAQQLPWTQFWLPTKESKLVYSMSAQIETAPNLTVRISASMVGGLIEGPFPTSSVDIGEGFQCPAKERDGKCGTCRACWDKGTKNVDYPQH